MWPAMPKIFTIGLFMERFPTPDLMTAYPHKITFFGLPFLTKELQSSYD